MEPKILTTQQEKFLKCVAARRNFQSLFYLTGGTALAAFYLFHRYSEDLDFFSEKEVESVEVISFVLSLRKGLKFKKAEFQTRLNRQLVFLSFPGEKELKVEFTYYPGPPLEKRKRFHGVWVDSLLDIAVNKAFTIAQNARTRDFIDLYLIWKRTGWEFQSLLKKGRAKFDVYVDPIQLGSQLLRVTELRDYPRMILKIKDRDWQDFFLKEAKKLKKSVLK
jgi:predicted nucleotidyltransferase component of viral defense system